ncbi:MAG: small acid-soluble spore protein SspI [Bacillaceae bacterium]|nr:small acid-soluble spore protein SspI [Bacillaceae bacterium]
MNPEDIDLREAVIKNMENSSQEEIRMTIVDAIEKGEEKTLPGLGVLFEVMWNNISENEKNNIIETLEANLKL